MLDQAVEKLKGKQKGNFKKLIKLFEDKKYGKGLKAAEKLLKDVPQHAETKVIKALFRYHVSGEFEKCEAEAKAALMTNLKSPFCWNICGMISKLNKKHAIAAKNFTQALRFDPSNQQILREATNLYLYSRDSENHLEYRRKMLFGNSSIMMNWCGFIAANHMMGYYDTALDACTSMLDLHKKQLERNKNKEGKEGQGILTIQDLNLVHLYRLYAYNYLKDWTSIVEYVDTNASEITDKVHMRQFLLQAQIGLGQKDKALENLDTMLIYLPENEEYITQYLKVIDASDADSLKLLFEKNKNSKVIPKLLLRTVDGSSQEFKDLFTAAYRKAAKKIAPSFYREVQALYKDETKVKIISDVLTENLESLEKNLKFHGGESEEFPTVLMYTYYLLGWHYVSLGENETALEYSTKCEEHTPTFLENIELKSKIFKRLRRYKDAADCIKGSYKQDKADRYIVNKTVKYMMQNGEICEADALFKTFMFRNEAVERTLHTLQKIWYEHAMAKAYFKQRKWARGLKMFNFIQKNLEAIAEDQNDFYSFALRKYNIINFIDMANFNSVTFMQDKRYIEGYCNFLRCGLIYQRNSVIEEAILEEKTKEMPKVDAKKFKKEFQRQKEANTVKIKAELMKELEIDGSEYIKTFNLKEISIMAGRSRPSLRKHQKLAYTALFDHSESIGNHLLMLKYIRALGACLPDNHLEYVFRLIIFLKRAGDVTGDSRESQYFKKLVGELNKLSWEEELSKLAERAKSCLLARTYEIIVRAYLGEYSFIDNVTKLEEFMRTELSEKLVNSPVYIVSLILELLNEYCVDYQLLVTTCDNAGVQLGFRTDDI